ncbi:MAG TPA: M20/M25/M40 family metallo-hydrolase [Thermomicrobiales bacterium]|nr:M20/M25/M40 family metallo-hydrolase [Thermomicrobiales bacterium]
MDFTNAFAAVDAQEGTLVERLRSIIAIDNCVPPGRNYDTLLDLVEPEFKRLGFETARVVIPWEKVQQIPLPLEGERVNLVARQNNGKPPLTVYAHMDTVPIEEGWTHDPFGGEIEDGRIYGRGIADMKGTIATLLTALDVMQQQGIEPVWDLNVVLCTDEEIGVYPGLYHLALEGYVTAPVLCMEGGQDPLLRLGSNGAVDVTITVHGRSCHSGANYLGINAIEEMVPILNELIALKHEVESRRSELPLAPAPGAPSNLRPMFNLDIVGGGVKSNIVPATASLVVNRRYIPEEKYEDVAAEIREAVDRGMEKSRALSVDVSFMHAYPSYYQSPDHPGAKRLVEALKLVQGYSDEDFVRSGSGGSTDMAYVAQVLKTDQIATVGNGRQKESKPHGSDESIRLSDARAHAKELIYYFAAPLQNA